MSNYNFDFYMPVRIVAGDDCVKKFNFTHLGKKCLIMTGKSSAKKSGLLDDIIKNLDNSNIEYIIYDEIIENPPVELCYEASLIAKDNNIEFIIGAGGGSVMDAAKATSIYATNILTDYMDIFKGVFSKRALPLVLIGTTAGTGSEVTAVSVLTVTSPEGRQYKKSIKSPKLYPLYSLSDSKYTESLSWEVTVNTALDTISHSIEALYSKKAGRMEMLYAKEAIYIAWKALKNSHWQVIVENRNIEKKLRDDLKYASILAGLAINGVGTCFPHALGYALTTYKNTPHGKACALFLSRFLDLQWGADKTRDEIFLKAIDENKNIFIEDLNKLLINLPHLTLDEIEYYSSQMYNYPSLSNSIVVLSNDEIENMYMFLSK